MRRSIVSAAVAAALVSTSAPVFAGGFGIGTQSGSGTGNAFAGGAAAEDASTVWYNPAGMSYLPAGRHVSGVAHALKPSFKFNNAGSTGAFAAPGTGEGGDGGDWAFVPQGYFATDIGRNLKLGFALNVPFGLTTEYDAGWRGQFTALKSEIKTINLNGALSYRVSDTFSVGFGLSYQRIEAELTQFAGPAGIAKIEGDDDNWGYNIGVMFSPSPSTRVGLHYRSSIGYKIDGDVSFSAAPAGNSRVSADLRVPGSFALSIFHSVNPKWDVMGDITYTRWGTVETLNVVRTSLVPGALVSQLPLNWDDTWRFSVGANYRHSDAWKFRFGLAWDPTPTNDTDRTARLPDEDRFWVAFGANYKISKQASLDFGYAHEFIRDASVNNAVAGVPGRLIGNFENKADIFSVQFNYSF
jgi:long-chain fatty acid transport protein